MDALDKAIAEEEGRHRKYVAQEEAFRQKAEQSALKLATLRHAATLRPEYGPPAPVTQAEDQADADPEADDGDEVEEQETRHRGRQEGAISHRWRRVLEMMAGMPRRCSYAEIHALAEVNGMRLDIASVRERVRGFSERGYLSGTPNEGFKVTRHTIDRFGFQRETVLPGEAPDKTVKPEG